MFLGSVGTVLSAGLLGRRAFAADDPLVVRVWRSEAAAAYDDLPSQVRGYLEVALEPLVGAVDVQVVDDPVALRSEQGRTVLSRRWPRMVVRGMSGLGDVDPVTGVNLLVTDGDPTNHPAGFARPHVAAVTGAGAIARMDPPEEAGTIVKYSVPAATIQLLLHECGHALGLSHDHGAAYPVDDGVVVTPMVSSYFWASPSLRERELSDRNVCGQGYAATDVRGERRLRLRYADCAARAIQR